MTKALHRSILAALCATSALASGAADAQTRYYMRERLIGVQPASAQQAAQTYTAQTTWSTCTPGSQGSTAGTQSGTITSCTSSSGASVATSNCAAPGSRACTISSYSQTYAYAACSNSSQTGSISSCVTTSSTGETGQVANGLCPSSTQTTTRNCKVATTCPAMTTSRVWKGGVASQVAFTNFAATSTADALSKCQSMTSPDQTKQYLKYCYYYTGNGNSGAGWTAGASTDPSSVVGSDSGFYGSVCS